MQLLEKVGNTPLITLFMNGFEELELFIKLEYYNPTGSIKDRAASFILNKLLEERLIDNETTIIESSSGNFGIALSTYCKYLGLKFLCVIDPNITKVNEALIRSLSHEVIKVSSPDKHGGYLLNRIEKVQEVLTTRDNAYWINQYGSRYNADAYYSSLGNELCNELDHIDYVFIGVSSGGTITGLSRRIKEQYPNCKIVAVDAVGSVIFGGSAKKRFIPGVGSSMVPDILADSLIDEVVKVEEFKAIKMCHRLLNESFILAGGSSGLVISAIEEYFKGKVLTKKPKVLTIFPDRGDRYMDTIYNQDWIHQHFTASNLANEF